MLFVAREVQFHEELSQIDTKEICFYDRLTNHTPEISHDPYIESTFQSS